MSISDELFQNYLSQVPDTSIKTVADFLKYNKAQPLAGKTQMQTQNNDEEEEVKPTYTQSNKK